MTKTTEDWAAKAREVADKIPPHGSTPKALMIDVVAQALEDAEKAGRDAERERCVKVVSYWRLCYRR